MRYSVFSGGEMRRAFVLGLISAEWKKIFTDCRETTLHKTAETLLRAAVGGQSS